MPHKDKNGKIIVVGDVIHEGTIGKKIWDGTGVIVDRPYGVVIRKGKRKLNVRQLHQGRVKVTKKCKLYNIYGEYCPVNLSRYDGQFEWPEDIEVCGHIKEDE